jgi:hypothetical protein
MSLEQLIGRYLRLKEELVIAYSSLPWNAGRIDPLTHDMALTEREISALRALHQRAEETAGHTA